MIKVFIAEVGTIDLLFSKYISTESLERLAKMKSKKNCTLSLWAELLARSFICEELGIKNSSLCIERSSFDKPFLPDYPSLHFNVSHTNNAVAIAISTSPVGIDIEHCGRKLSARVIKRICNPNEIKQLAQGLAPIELWTKKEALFKRDGQKLYFPISHLDTTSSPIYTWLINNYATAVCCDEVPAAPVILTAADLNKMLLKLDEHK